MINKLVYHINKLLIMLVLYIAGSSIQIHGQEEIGGIINHYAKVNSISPGLVTVTPAQASQFAAGDYVLLIQMQGVGIQTAQGAFSSTKYIAER